MRIFTLLSLLFFAGFSASADLVEQKNLAYSSVDERCKLDVYRPAEGHDLPCLLWFHGGGLTAGTKDDAGTVATARALAQNGIVVATINYRLSPKHPYPAYLDDTAAAFHWIKQHASEHQASDKKIHLAGHSAGGYLVTMLASDPRWLRKQGDKIEDIAGIVSLSGQMVTHFTIRAERGIADTTIIVDQDAPMHYAKNPCAPQLILYAEQDMAMRAEENVLYLSARKAAGHANVRGWMVKGSDHGNIGNDVGKPGNAVQQAIIDFIRKPKTSKP